MKKIIFLISVLISGFSFAQDANFSDNTLQKFADAYKEVRNENMTLQLNMISAIENAGLTSDKFTDIHMALKDPNAEKPSSDDKRKYDDALKGIESLNKDIQDSIERIIVRNGLEVKTYQAIAEAYSKNAVIKEKINKLIN